MGIRQPTSNAPSVVPATPAFPSIHQVPWGPGGGGQQGGGPVNINTTYGSMSDPGGAVMHTSATGGVGYASNPFEQLYASLRALAAKKAAEKMQWSQAPASSAAAPQAAPSMLPAVTAAREPMDLQAIYPDRLPTAAEDLAVAGTLDPQMQSLTPEKAAAANARGSYAAAEGDNGDVNTNLTMPELKKLWPTLTTAQKAKWKAMGIDLDRTAAG